jgi:hypothetical protein
MNGIPWLPVLGNHDYKQGLATAEAQVVRTTATDDDEWQFPSKTWVRMIPVGLNSQLALVAIDTQEMFFSDYSYTNAIFSDSDAKLAVARLEAELASAASIPTTTWIVVMGHFPILSRGEHGDNEVLSELLLPIFAKYGVDAYFAGHDHTMQHIEYEDMHFIINGNGAKRGTVVDDDQTAEPYLSSAYVTRLRVVDPGFTAHSVNATKMTTSFIDAGGAVIHYFEQAPRCKRNCSRSASAMFGVFKSTLLLAALGCILVSMSVTRRYCNADHDIYSSCSSKDELGRLLEDKEAVAILKLSACS